MIKHLLFAGGLLAAGSTFSQQGLEKIIVEKYYVSNAQDSIGSIGNLSVGSVTYRVYADMLPGYKFQALYGDPSHTLLIKSDKSFFNNEDRGATTANAIPSVQLKNNTVGLDSWISVGAAATGQMGVLKSEDDGKVNLLPGVSDKMLKNNDTAMGIFLKDQDGMIAGTPEAVTTLGIDSDLAIFDASNNAKDSIFQTNNGAISALNGATGPTAENRVLLGQFTTKGQFAFELNIQIGTPTPGVSQRYVAKNPANGEFSIPSLIYKSPKVISTPPVDTTHHAGLADLNTLNASFYPVPTNGKLNIQLNEKTSGVFAFELMSLDGKKIYTQELSINGKNAQVDLSTISKGVYFAVIRNNENQFSQRIIIE